MLTNWGTISNSIKKLKKLEIDISAENRIAVDPSALVLFGAFDDVAMWQVMLVVAPNEVVYGRLLQHLDHALAKV